MISIVVPVFNEEESLEAFYKVLTAELAKLKLSHEILFIDDGSTDNSLAILKEFQKNNKAVRVYSFRTNQGKAEALTLGFQKAKGEKIITLDADLQDQPSEITKFLAKSEEGVDVVCGWRKDRKDASKMVIISRLFNYTLGKLFGLRLHDYNCGFKLYSSDAAKSLRLYGGQHRFIPLLVHQEGFSVAEIPVRHEPRKFGKSKYSFSKIKDLPDIFSMLFLARYSKRPLHFFGFIGGIGMLVGFLILGYLTILHLMGQSIGRRPLLTFGVLFVLAGLQIFFTGFIAELLTNISQRTNMRFPLKYASDKA